MNPKYPIYILSKGRADTRLTSKSLERMGVDYKIVVEDSEYDDYAAVIEERKVMALPTDFRENPKYNFPDLDGNVGGSIPVRNFIWEHSLANGDERHWILDDNIRHFYRINRNVKARVSNGTTFRCCEDFTDRYKNVALSGMNYQFFIPKDQGKPPYYSNTRIYSCILIKNDIDFRWRGLYNEDTDLSLRVLKDGWCTILFNAFLCGKSATLTMKGGNTEDVYKQGDDEFDNRYKFAKSLYDQHPDCVKITKKWGRWHHHVDYDRFQVNKLEYRDDFVLPEGYDEHGMVLGRYTSKEAQQHDEGIE
jgi:hypothetical protein